MYVSVILVYFSTTTGLAANSVIYILHFLFLDPDEKATLKKKTECIPNIQEGAFYIETKYF